jgi:hypothetical protein
MCALKPGRHRRPNRDDAETIAFQALGFLAEEPNRIGRFLSLTGMEPASLMEGAETAAVQVAILDHLLGDESLLMVFSGHAGINPEQVAVARSLLADEEGRGPG